MNFIYFYPALIWTNIRSAFATGFWLQIIFMILNNLIFWVIWTIYFRTFGEINGWGLPEVTLMYATTQLAWGLKVALFGGGRNLAKMIADGELDQYLLQPRNPLFHILSTRSFASGWGDLCSGIALAIMSGLLTPLSAMVYGIAAICACLAFLAAEVCLHSLAFWCGPTNSFSRNLTEYIIMISCYPQNIYSGWIKLAMLVVLPAAVISYLPVKVALGDQQAGALIIGLTTMFILVALAVFFRGLGRYEQGMVS